MSLPDFLSLPPSVRKAVEDCQSFKTSYYSGRLAGLRDLDEART